MEPTKEAASGDGVKPVACPVVQIDEGRIQAHPDEVVRSTVEETGTNRMLGRLTASQIASASPDCIFWCNFGDRPPDPLAAGLASSVEPSVLSSSRCDTYEARHQARINQALVDEP